VPIEHRPRNDLRSRFGLSAQKEWARTEARAQVVSGEMSAHATIAAAWFKVAKAPGMNETSASMRQLKRINMAGSLSDRVRDKRDVIRRIGLAM
jgi:hypothetical protein